MCRSDALIDITSPSVQEKRCTSNEQHQRMMRVSRKGEETHSEREFWMIEGNSGQNVQARRCTADKTDTSWAKVGEADVQMDLKPH